MTIPFVVVVLLTVGGEALPVKKSLPDLSLPPLPKCSDGFNTGFERIWEAYVNETYECPPSEQLIVLSPNNGALQQFSLADFVDPFLVSDLLGMKTVLAHTFTGTLEEDQAVLTSKLDGSVGTLERNEKGEILVNGLTATPCPLGGTSSCVRVFSLRGLIKIDMDDVNQAYEEFNNNGGEWNFDPWGVPFEESSDNDNDLPDGSEVIFPEVHVPEIIDEVKEYLEEGEGQHFLETWSTLLEQETTREEEGDVNMIVLVPSNRALNRLIPELREEVPDPITFDVPLMQHIITSHIIMEEGNLPKDVFDSVPEFQQIVKKNLLGEAVVFHREVDGNGASIYKANGITLENAQLINGKVSMFQLDTVFFSPSARALVKEAISRAADFAGVESPYPDPQPIESFGIPPGLIDIDIPKLASPMSYAMRLLGANRFAGIWLDLETNVQTWHAETEDNFCLHPADTGPCRRKIGRYFFNPASGRCEPFIYGGCGGNDNNFNSLLACSETCVTDPKITLEVRQDVCALPLYKYQSEPRNTLECENRARPVFHYNMEEGKCEELKYSGCFGTDNKFDSINECHKVCGAIDIRAGSVPDFINPEKLTIIAPSDGAIVDVISASDEQTTTFFSKRKNELMTRSFVLGAISRESCDGKPEDAFIETLDPSFMVKCSELAKNTVDTFVAGSNSAGFKIILVDTVDTVSPNMIRSFNNQPDLEERGRGKCPVSRSLDLAGLDPECEESEQLTRSDEYSLFDSSEFAAAYLQTASIPELTEDIQALLKEGGAEEFLQLWESLEEPTTGALTSDVPDICLLPHQDGDCSWPGSFYFDHKIGACVPALDKACVRNSNRFSSYQLCSDFCGTFQGKVASVPIEGEGVTGVVTFSQANADSPVYLKGHIEGLTPGKHGFHVHAVGDTSDGCKAAGGHFNPFGLTHGSPSHATRHVGDLGNLATPPDGPTLVDFSDSVITLFGEHSIIGRSVVVHAGEDDLGLGGDDGSLATGNAGGRVACGVIAEEENRKTAVAQMQGNVTGTVRFRQAGPMSPVVIEGLIDEGLAPGLHGFHVHEFPDLGDECYASGSHYNPMKVPHGGRDAPVRHIGDLGNIETFAVDAKTPIYIEDPVVSLYGLYKISNRTIDVHAGEDDLGLGENDKSSVSGNAGTRLGCGIIEEQGEPDAYAVEDNEEPANTCLQEVTEDKNKQAPCRKTQPLWTFNSSRKQCERYLYSGCASNFAPNLYDTEDQCRQACRPVDRGLTVYAPSDAPLLALLSNVSPVPHLVAKQLVLCHVARGVNDKSLIIEHETLCGFPVRTVIAGDGKATINGDVEAVEVGTRKNAKVLVVPGILQYDAQVSEATKKVEASPVLLGGPSSLPPAYLAIEGHANCLGTCSPSMDATHTERCFPAVAPEGCRQEVYDQLKNKFTGNNCPTGDSNICVVASRLIGGPAVLPPEYLSIEGHADCLDTCSPSVDATHTERCFPAAIPQGCSLEVYEQLKVKFDGKPCPDSGSDSNLCLSPVRLVGGPSGLPPAYLSVEGHSDCLGDCTPFIGASHTERCFPKTIPEGCSQEAYEELREKFAGKMCSESEDSNICASEDVDAIPRTPVRAVAIGPLPVRPNPLRLPAQDKALKDGAEKVNVKTFFDVWDRLMQTDLGELDEGVTEYTIVTGEDMAFRSLLPADAIDPFVVDDILQRQVIGSQLIKGRVAPDDVTAEGTKVKSVAGYVMNFKSDGSTLTIEDVPVKAVQTTNNAVIYVVEKLIFIDRRNIEQALTRFAKKNQE